MDDRTFFAAAHIYIYMPTFMHSGSNVWNVAEVEVALKTRVPKQLCLGIITVVITRIH